MGKGRPAAAAPGKLPQPRQQRAATATATTTKKKTPALENASVSVDDGGESRKRKRGDDSENGDRLDDEAAAKKLDNGGKRAKLSTDDAAPPSAGKDEPAGTAKAKKMTLKAPPSGNWKKLAEAIGAKVTPKHAKPVAAPKPAAEISEEAAKAAILEKETNGKMKIGKYVAIDCEMVGVGPEGTQSALARVSLVNYDGNLILDRYVKPVERVTDFRTQFSGITPKILETAHDFAKVQKEVADVIKGKILVGHAIVNDLQALLLDHPRKAIRDTSRYKPFRALAKGNTPALRKLAAQILGVQIQGGSHSSIEDARATMALFRKYHREWEASIASKGKTMPQKKDKPDFFGD